MCSLETIKYLPRDKKIAIYSNNKVVRDNLSVNSLATKVWTFVFLC